MLFRDSCPATLFGMFTLSAGLADVESWISIIARVLHGVALVEIVFSEFGGLEV
jgi:hypothetical protein